MKKLVLASLVAAMAFWLGSEQPPVRAEESDPKVKEQVTKGLNWLAKNQKGEGHWEANGGAYPSTCTALAGVALLSEGSTCRDGKYAKYIQKAVDWFITRSQANGLLGNPKNQTESMRYIYGHGYGMLFLSQVYGEEDDAVKRKKLEEILTKAVEFSGKAQTKLGGWGYVSSADGNGFDEGSTTITQLQGLRACKNAGIHVPKSIIEASQKYLKDATTDRGAIKYSLQSGHGEGGPALVAAAIAGGQSTGDYDSPQVKKWLGYCRTNLPVNNAGRLGHDEYTHYYYSQALYLLGEAGYQKIFKDTKAEDCLTWSKYKKQKFDSILKSQKNDGCWDSGNIGAVYSTSINLTILQLDNAVLPIYQR